MVPFLTCLSALVTENLFYVQPGSNRMKWSFVSSCIDSVTWTFTDIVAYVSRLDLAGLRFSSEQWEKTPLHLVCRLDSVQTMLKEIHVMQTFSRIYGFGSFAFDNQAFPRLQRSFTKLLVRGLSERRMRFC